MLVFKAKMRWSKNEAIGFLHRFWWTVLEYAPDGVISTLPPVVMSETLGMDFEQYEQTLAALEEAGFVRRHEDTLLVHDWLDYAGRYLRETKFKGKNDRLSAIERLHSASTDNPRKVHGFSTVPTNQPNQPTNPPPDVGFEKFWKAWPQTHRKAAKQQCLAKWRAHGLEERAEEIVAALERFKQTPDWKKENGQYVPAPLVWLNQSRWEAMTATSGNGAAKSVTRLTVNGET